MRLTGVNPSYSVNSGTAVHKKWGGGVRGKSGERKGDEKGGILRFIILSCLRMGEGLATTGGGGEQDKALNQTSSFRARSSSVGGNGKSYRPESD